MQKGENPAMPILRHTRYACVRLGIQLLSKLCCLVAPKIAQESLLNGGILTRVAFLIEVIAANSSAITVRSNWSAES